MAEGDKTYYVRYKNHCTPQEQLVAGGRYYLDSDCGRKLTGDTTILGLTAAGTLTSGVSVTSSVQSIASGVDFIYVKNTGTSYVYISLVADTAGDYLIVLRGGEAFASEISTSANVRVKCVSGETSTIDHFSET